MWWERLVLLFCGASRKKRKGGGKVTPILFIVERGGKGGRKVAFLSSFLSRTGRGKTEGGRKKKGGFSLLADGKGGILRKEK